MSAANERALIRLVAARATQRAAGLAAAEAKADLHRATEVLHGAQYAAITSIDCPYSPCGAKAGEACWGESLGNRYQLGLLAQHGIRADVAGVHGHESRRHALRILARIDASRTANQESSR